MYKRQPGNNQPTQQLPVNEQTVELQAAKSAPLQPAIVTAAQIAFAAVLLYMSTQPINTAPEMMAQNEPVLTITIPGNEAIASTAVATMDPLIEPVLIQTSH